MSGELVFTDYIAGVAVGLFPLCGMLMLMGIFGEEIIDTIKVWSARGRLLGMLSAALIVVGFIFVTLFLPL